jgi:hypothetical protein
MELRLSEAECELLVQILEERYAHFLQEISRSHHHREFRQTLRQRCDLLEKVMEKLKGKVPSAT